MRNTRPTTSAAYDEIGIHSNSCTTDELKLRVRQRCKQHEAMVQKASPENGSIALALPLRRRP
eukprot:2151915-Pleurochrysis_carterae.AAC.3